MFKAYLELGRVACKRGPSRKIGIDFGLDADNAVPTEANAILNFPPIVTIFGPNPHLAALCPQTDRPL